VRLSSARVLQDELAIGEADRAEDREVGVGQDQDGLGDAGAP
jgi:hypothetical protein